MMNIENIPKEDTRGRKKIVIGDDVKYAVRRKIHAFYLKNELPTLKKIAAAIESDRDLPKLSSHVLRRTLSEMNFKFLKRNRKSLLIDKEEIVLWRRRYLNKIREIQSAGQKIYYMDETWLNEGHTVNKVWQDLNIKSRRQAFMEGFSTGLTAPSGKGRRLIITHIGSDSGFLENGLLVFESKKSGDYHEDMNSDVFERWFSSILPNLEPEAVVIMDNAPYHSRCLEALPTTAWRKDRISEWLAQKNISFKNTMLKIELLDIARAHKTKYVKYAVDELATAHGITVLRLPPHHCELNPIELIWAEVKGNVARNNTTFKLGDVKILFENAIRGVTAVSWQKCIGHVIKEEQRFWELDMQIEVLVEPLIINVGGSADTETSDISSADEESD